MPIYSIQYKWTIERTFLVKVLSVVCLLFFSLITFGQKPILNFSFDNKLANDISGNNNNGILIGNITADHDRFGNPCGAMYFDGSTGFIEVPNSKSLSLPSNKFAVTSWFKLDYNKAQTLRGLSLICKGETSIESPSNPHYRTQFFQFAKESTVSINSEFTENDLTFDKHLLTPGMWHHIAITYNGNNVKFFLNGEKVWEFLYSGKLIPNNSPLLIAKDIPGSTEFLAGSLDDLKIYDQDLTESFINSEFQLNSNYSYSSPTSFNLSCSENIIKQASGIDCNARVTWELPKYNSFPCINLKLEQIEGSSQGTFFPIGIHNIGYALKNVDNNDILEMCQFEIQVEPTNNLIFKCNKDTTIITQDSKGSRFNFSDPIPLSGCGQITLAQVEGLRNGDIFPVGSNKVKFEGKDSFGNSANCSFNVIVKYFPKPVEIKASNPVIIKKDQSDSTQKPILVVKKESNPTQPDTSDTSAKKNLAKTDSTSSLISGSNNIKKEIVKDKVDIQYNVKMKSCLYTFLIYDGDVEDGDTISIYFNDALLINKQKIRNKISRGITGVIQLVPNQENFITCKAHNLGTVGKNTCHLLLYRGRVTMKEIKKSKPEFSRKMNSSIGISATIKLICT